MRVAIIGANGQLGSDVVLEVEKRGWQVSRLDHQDCDVTDLDAVERAFSDVHPDAIVNTAAMHHLAKCEEDPIRAFATNAVGARNVCVAAAAVGARVVQISTDYVFDGSAQRPYVEDDHTGPLNVYGASKRAGEHFVLAYENGCVVRTSGLYGVHPCRGKGGLNFVERMLDMANRGESISVVTDEVVSPTSTTDLARFIADVLDARPRGVLHATAGGECSWYEFAVEIFRQAAVAVMVAPRKAIVDPRGVRRPAYSVLNSNRIDRLGLTPLPSWRDGLARYLECRNN